MTNRDKEIERDRFIVEWFGEKWHMPELLTDPVSLQCSCGKPLKSLYDICRNPDLSTPKGFFWLWPMMRNDDKLWERFKRWIHKDQIFSYIALCALIDNPSTFADAVYKFLKGQVKG